MIIIRWQTCIILMYLSIKHFFSRVKKINQQFRNDIMIDDIVLNFVFFALLLVGVLLPATVSIQLSVRSRLLLYSLTTCDVLVFEIEQTH